ncbi:MAG: YicC family protein [Bacteroidia bacterium]
MRSMTGYGVAEKHTQKYDVKVEVRSLNGKYLDMNFRMPRYLLSRELVFRNLVSKKIERGSVTVNIHVIKHGVEDSTVNINKDLAKAYYNQLKELSEELGAQQHDIFRITTLMQDVIYTDDDEVDPVMIEAVKEVLLLAFEKFDEFRLTEGAQIQEHVKECCSNIEALIPEVEGFEPQRLEITKERLQKSLNALMEDENYDKNRFEQELIYYIEKFDISEEKKRLQAHCEHFQKALLDSPKGKKLNFIAQEMGREINTMGSKANHSDIQKCVISMKEELEKIKEQALNIL